MAHGDKKTPSKPSKPSNHPDEEISMVLALKEEIAALRKQVKDLTNRLDEVESLAGVTASVNSHLQKEVDRLEQYGRRHSVVIRGIIPEENEQNDQLVEKVRDIVGNQLNLKSDFNRDFDKTHRIGPIIKTKDGPRQDVIVRFKSHSVRYRVYNKRKEINKERKIRITPSLTNIRRKLLSTARDRYESKEQVDYIFTDVHGDIKVKFKSKIKDKLFHELTCIEDLEVLLGINEDEI